MADAVRTAYPEGRSIGALAREYDVSRGAIRTAVADLLPDRDAKVAIARRNSRDRDGGRCDAGPAALFRPPAAAYRRW